MSEALSRFRVIEAQGGLAAAYAGHVLARFGVSVAVVEHVDAAGTAEDASVVERALAAFLVQGKERSVGTPAELRARLADADVLLVGDDLAALQAWGLDPAELRAAFPRLSVVTITPFGLDGPMAHAPAGELTLQALSGLMAFSGSAEREPLMRGLRQSAYATGLNAAYTALTAIYAAGTHGEGTLVDIATREVLASELVLNQPTFTYIGAVQGRLPGSKDVFFAGSPLPAKDGLVSLQINNRTSVSSFAGLLEEPGLMDERFSTAEGRLTHAVELTELVERALARFNGRALFEAAAAHGLLAGYVQDAASLLECPQLEARGAFTEVEVDGRTVRLVDELVSVTRFAQQPLQVAGGAA